MKWALEEDPVRTRREAPREDPTARVARTLLSTAGTTMSYANRFPSTQHTRYRSSWGPSSVSVFNRADVPRPSPEEEEFADFYHERLHSAQSRQLIPLQEDLADWINKTISELLLFVYSSFISRARSRARRFDRARLSLRDSDTVAFVVTPPRSAVPGGEADSVRNFDNRQILPLAEIYEESRSRARSRDFM